MKKLFLTTAIFSSILLLSACSTNDSNNQSSMLKKASDTLEQKELVSLNESFYKSLTEVKIDHIHGIGYSGNINGLLIASHSGLKIYSADKWYETSKNKHDYMGFQATSDGFYSSGHPEPGSNLKNPLGLVRSIDGNKTLETIDFYGETDFHNMAVGYYSKAIFLYNQDENSKLGSGFYYSADLGKNWTSVKGSGLPDTLTSFTIHPDDPNMIAMNSQEGIYLSTNRGESFERITTELTITSSILLKNKIVYSFVKDNKSYLEELELSTNKSELIPIPSLDTKNMIMYIAVDQNNPETISIATMESNIYTSNDFGENWIELIKQ